MASSRSAVAKELSTVFVDLSAIVKLCEGWAACQCEMAALHVQCRCQWSHSVESCRVKLNVDVEGRKLQLGAARAVFGVTTGLPNEDNAEKDY
jgi:hypothetical protein